MIHLQHTSKKKSFLKLIEINDPLQFTCCKFCSDGPEEVLVLHLSERYYVNNSFSAGSIYKPQYNHTISRVLTFVAYLPSFLQFNHSGIKIVTLRTTELETEITR